MNYNKKLESLAKEFETTMNHAEEVLNEYIDIAIERAMVDAFNELTPDEQMTLIFGLLCDQVEDIIAEELTAVAEAIEKVAKEEEMRRYEEERKKEFAKLPDDVLKHLKRLGVKF